MKKYYVALRALFIALATLILTASVCIVISEFAPLWLEIVFFGSCWFIAIGYLTLLIYSKLKK